MIVRPETTDDVDAISAVTIAAFKTLDVSNQTEQYLVAGLRKAGALTVSLVAEIDGRIVGHIAFSPVKISDGTRNWYGMGPVSVLPEYQKQDIGKSLVREGLRRVKELGGAGCALVGHPDYYKKFGFSNPAQLVHEGVPPEAFMVLPLSGEVPQGTVDFHEAFLAEDWPSDG